MKTKIQFFYLLLFLITSPAKAQEWEFVGLDSLAVYHLVISASGDTIYAGTIDRNINPNIIDGLYFTSNRGVSWVQLDSALGDGYVNGLNVISPQNLFILKTEIIYKTTNSGLIWMPITNISTNPIKWFGVSPFNTNEIYAIDVLALGGGRYFNSLFKSTNRGNSWKSIGSFPGSSHGSELRFAFDMTDSMNLYVCVDDRWTSLYLFKSTDKGENWIYVSAPPIFPNDFYTDKIIPNRIYLLGGIYIYISSTGGYNWFSADSGLTGTSYYLSFFQDQLTTNLLYILESNGLYYSRNDTVYWQKVEGSENLPLDLPPTTKNMSNIKTEGGQNKIYLGTSDGLFSRDILTYILHENRLYLNGYLLHQNFPNPFNLETVIKYYLPLTTHTILKVYDLLGNELVTLVDEENSVGSHEIKFDAINYTSGVYIYSLTAGIYRESKKMVIIK